MELRNAISGLIADLQREKRERFHRRVPVGDLLTDRWQTARDYQFGEGTSCYDNVLIIGDVVVGRATVRFLPEGPRGRPELHAEVFE